MTGLEVLQSVEFLKIKGKEVKDKWDED